MKYIILLFILNSGLARAKTCANYNIFGFVKVIDKNLFIIINENTKSEIKLSTKMELEPQLIAYENRPITSTLSIEQPLNGTKGNVIEISRIELSIPDSILAPNKSNFNFIKNTECKE
jgi:hypothetical protein